MESIEILRNLHKPIKEVSEEESGEDIDYLKIQIYWRFHARETVLSTIKETLTAENDSGSFNEIKGLAWRIAAKLSKWEIIDP